MYRLYVGAVNHHVNIAIIVALLLEIKERSILINYSEVKKQSRKVVTEEGGGGGVCYFWCKKIAHAISEAILRIACNLLCKFSDNKRISEELKMVSNIQKS